MGVSACSKSTPSIQSAGVPFILSNIKSAITLLATLALTLQGASADPEESSVPKSLNVVFILADDLGWGELGCYGQTKIRTPHIDQLAAEGSRFTQHYSGAPVCAPARCVLLTGKHLGHAEIRGNQQANVLFPQFKEGQQPISADTFTVAQAFQSAGFATGAVGKWGLGPVDSTGDPNKHGFDLAGTVNEAPGYFADWFPTLCAATGVKSPDGLDGENLWPVITSGKADKEHRPMVWIYPEYGGQVAVRIGDFMVLRRDLGTAKPEPWEVYDLKSDCGEQHNLAAGHGDLIRQAVEILNRGNTPNKVFPMGIPTAAGTAKPAADAAEE